MATARFSDNDINAASAVYQRIYKADVVQAIDDYLHWSMMNARGIPFITKFGHFTHGDDGRQIATELKILLSPLTPTSANPLQCIPLVPS